MSTLELTGIVAGYGNHEVLRGVSLGAGTGSVVAVLGPNGVGKTTLINVALGWIRPRAGTVLVEGRPIDELSGGERGRLVSLVPQNDHIPFEYTILEYVLLGRAPHLGRMETPRARDVDLARDAIETVGLSGTEDHGVLTTSAGERQLVLLARSLAQDPRVLLLDEPSAHLDLANKRRLVTLLRRESEHRCVVFSVHEPEFAAAVADTVVLLGGGRVLATGSPREVMTSELLSRTYGIPIRVERVSDRSVYLW